MIRRHDDKQIIVTVSSHCEVGGITTNVRHTWPTLNTSWWPDTVMELINKEFEDRRTKDILMVEIENV